MHCYYSEMNCRWPISPHVLDSNIQLEYLHISAFSPFIVTTYSWIDLKSRCTRKTVCNRNSDSDSKSNLQIHHFLQVT